LLNRLYGNAARQRLEQANAPAEPAEPILTAEEQQFLRVQLGWFGALALTSDENAPPALRQEVMRQAQRPLIGIGIAVGWFLLLGLAGLIGLAVLGLGLRLGAVRSRLTTGAGGGVYAETFALWMGLFMGLSWLVGQLSPPDTKFLLLILAFFTSLL